MSFKRAYSITNFNLAMNELKSKNPSVTTRTEGFLMSEKDPILNELDPLYLSVYLFIQ